MLHSHHHHPPPPPPLLTIKNTYPDMIRAQHPITTPVIIYPCIQKKVYGVVRGISRWKSANDAIPDILDETPIRYDTPVHKEGIEKVTFIIWMN